MHSELGTRVLFCHVVTKPVTWGLLGFVLVNTEVLERSPGRTTAD